MDALAHQLTKLSIWGLPIIWLLFSVYTWKTHSCLVGCLLMIAGLSGFLWNLFFMPINEQLPVEMWKVMIYVEYTEAPLGHFLSVYLPLLSKSSLVLAVALLAYKQNA